MEENSFTCCACKQALSKDSFSKKQFYKLEKDSSYQIKCKKCLETEENAVKKASKEKKKSQKVIDPSQLYFLSPLNAPVMKDFQRFFFNQYGIEPEISLGKKTKWRTAVKLAVRAEFDEKWKLGTEIGLFMPGSHKVVDCTNSAMHHARINEAVTLIKKVITELGINGYMEGTEAEDKKIVKHNAYLRYLLLSVERKSGLVQLSLVWNSSKTASHAIPVVNSLVDRLVADTLVKNNEQLGYKKSKLFHSIWINYFPASIHDNAISGRITENWELKFGKEYMMEQFSNLDFQSSSLSSHKQNKVILPSLYFPPFVFRQANIDKFEEILLLIREKIKEFKGTFINKEQQTFKCLELYGGVGTIGLNCLDLFDRLNCSDENPHNITCFNKSLEGLPTELKIKALYRSYGAASSVMNGEIHQHNIIIVDPPRKGMDEETMKAFLSFPTDHSKTEVAVSNGSNKRLKISFDEEGNVDEGGNNKKDEIMKKKRLIYISCGFEAFKRDCQLLTGRLPFDGNNKQNDSLNYQGSYNNKRKRQESNNDNENVDSTTDKQEGEGIKTNSWKLVYSKGFVLFPGSDHIETVAVFDRD
jgi:tRNA/tmRNA/rRNA uracil-C5-methylase (TrmA/RlmC/RlmD family)